MEDAEKPEYEPLLPVGRHICTLDELQVLCGDAFPTSETRPAIMAGLRDVVSKIAKVGLTGELWINGSFTTQKVDPEDVDVVLRLSAVEYDACTSEQQIVAEWLNGDLHDSHQCHSFVFFEWPEEHPLYWDGHYNYVYWMKQWGFSRQECRKGIAVIQFPIGDE